MKEQSSPNNILMSLTTCTVGLREKGGELFKEFDLSDFLNKCINIFFILLTSDYIGLLININKQAYAQVIHNGTII